MVKALLETHLPNRTARDRDGDERIGVRLRIHLNLSFVSLEWRLIS